MFLSGIIIAQSFELKSLSISTGKSATSSGYDINIGFSNGTNDFNVIGNHQRVYGTFSIPVGIPWLAVSASGGFYKNCPWIGPLVVFKPTTFLSTTHWYGLSAGHPDVPALEVNALIKFNSMTLTLGNLSASCAILTFDCAETDYIPGLKYTGAINGSWMFFLSTDYSTKNKEPLFMFGLKHAF